MLGSLWTVKSITCPSLNSLHVYPIGLLKEMRFSIEYLLVFLARRLQISGKVTSGKRDGMGTPVQYRCRFWQNTLVSGQ